MSSPVADRLLILGLDGATWTVLDPMRQRGLMPNLDALLARSAHGTLRSTIPPVTTAAWTTMMTGCAPARHGIFDHRYYHAPTRQMKVNHSGRRRVPTFWHALSDAGRTVVSLNTPGTYPPLKVRGVVVSGMDAPHLDAALSGSPEFAARMKAEVPTYTLRYYWKRVPQTLEELTENARLTAESFRGRALGGLLADRAFPDWSALMVQFQNLDPFQHRCWRFLNVDASGLDDPAWNDAAAQVIRGLDDAVGMLCELADRRGAAILACSDHGFGPCEGRISVNRILLAAGVAKALGPLGKLARRARLGVERWKLSSLKRDDPEARTASFAQSVAAQMPLDWRRTLAFAPHQDTAAMVYLNTRERHRGAPLVTPRQIDEARNEAAIALATARHPRDGRHLFPEVFSVADVYGVDPAAEGYPDLIALPEEAHWVRTRLAAGSSWVDPDPNLPGTHRPEGIVSVSGPGIKAGRTLRASLVDVAPSVLALFGLPIPDHVEGRPLPSLGLKSQPSPTCRIDRPASPVVGPHPPHGGFEYTAEEEAILEQRLADLGYLE
jgi:predicted AlkP superfamily phosphohydrolase/phosphomutase